MDYERIADSYLGLFDELSCEKVEKSQNVREFLKREKPLVDAIRQEVTTLKTFENNDKKLLGEGGYGKVFLVRHNKTRKIYALKCLSKKKLNKDNCFYMEERDILKLGNDSPWVIKLHYAFQDFGNLYLVMDFMQGGDLVRLINENESNFSEAAAKFYAAEIILGINAIHNFGFIHRDIKPDNVLIDNQGHVKLGDFGTCIRMNPGTNKVTFSSGPGTLDYVSPEVFENCAQRRQFTYGPELDWWSYGIMTYELIVGDTPFWAETTMETQQMIINFEKHLDGIYDDVNLSPQCQDFIGIFLKRRRERAGRNGPQDISDITSHQWFQDVDWNFQTIRDHSPPFPLDIKDEVDTSNFDKIEPAPEMLDTDFNTTPKPFEGNCLQFVGFSYNTLPQKREKPQKRSDTSGSLASGGSDLNKISELEVKIEELSQENFKIKKLKEDLEKSREKHLKEKEELEEELSSRATRIAATTLKLKSKENEIMNLKKDLIQVKQMDADLKLELEKNRDELNVTSAITEESENVIKNLQPRSDKFYSHYLPFHEGQLLP